MTSSPASASKAPAEAPLFTQRDVEDLPRIVDRLSANIKGYDSPKDSINGYDVLDYVKNCYVALESKAQKGLDVSEYKRQAAKSLLMGPVSYYVMQLENITESVQFIKTIRDLINYIEENFVPNDDEFTDDIKASRALLIENAHKVMANIFDKFGRGKTDLEISLGVTQNLMITGKALGFDTREWEAAFGQMVERVVAQERIKWGLTT